MLKRLLQVFSKNKKAVFLILLGSLTWSLTMVKSGIIYSYGMGFWGPNGHDGVWHIALIKGLAQGSLASGQDGLRPGWQIPIFAGEAIKNYHIGFNLILAALHKLTFIPVHNLYFQILPPIITFLIGIFVYKFVHLWIGSKTSAFWAVFFVYFGGGWGWLTNLIRNQRLGGESMFWSHQSISTLINPPYALSLVFIFAGLYCLLKGYKSADKKLLIAATFLFGVLVQIKVYAGILLMASLFAAALWDLWKRKGLAMIRVFTGSLIVAILIFSPTTKELGQTLIFKPFWFLETMMGFNDRFGWTKFGEAMVNYKLGGNWIRGIPAYFAAFMIFYMGNFGTRLIKLPLLFKHFKNFKRLSFMHILIYTLIGAGILIPTFYVQSGTPWNTIQFIYYALVFSGLIAGIYFGEFVEKTRLNRNVVGIFTFALVILTVPTSIGTLFYDYLPSRPPAMISKTELEALEFLSGQPEGIVLTQPFDKTKADAAVDNPPRPLYLYESTAYVSAFSGKRTFLEDEVNLEITGYNWLLRKDEVENYFADHLSKEGREFLLGNGIRYVYVVGDLDRADFAQNTDLSKIFENDEIQIYRVN
jgi:hypothetical protein